MNRYDRWSFYALGIVVGTLATGADPDVYWWNILGGGLLALAFFAAYVYGLFRGDDEESS